MSVWISDEKLLIFASLISPSRIIFFCEVISSIQHCVSLPDKSLSSALLGVSSGEETLRLMLDIAMLLFLYRRESLKWSKVFFLKLKAIFFYGKIHCKPLKLCNKSRRSGRIHLVDTCWKVPLVGN